MRRFVSLLLVVSLLFSSFTPVHAQALPSRVAVAVGGVIERNLARLGFAANDPRIANTLAAVGVAANDSVFGVASGVGMAAAGILGAPAWATVAIGLGIGALAFGAYKLLTSNTPGGIAVVLPGGAPVTSLVNQGWSPPGMVQSVYQVMGNPSTGVLPVDAAFVPFVVAAGALSGGWYFSGTLNPCLPGYLLCGQVVTAPALPQTVPGTLDQIAAQMPPAAMTTPIDPGSLADIANEALRRAAAQPGYQGVPVPLNQPITPQDVIDWGNANPGKMPTPADVLAPLPNGVVMPAPTGSASPFPNPFPLPTPTPTPTPTPSDTFLPPGMENTPTASQILAPILGLLPDFRSYVTPSHAATCPTPSVDVFGKHLVLDAHCTLLDSPSVRQVLYAVMAAVWTIVAIFIILAA